MNTLDDDEETTKKQSTTSNNLQNTPTTLPNQTFSNQTTTSNEQTTTTQTSTLQQSSKKQNAEHAKLKLNELFMYWLTLPDTQQQIRNEVLSSEKDTKVLEKMKSSNTGSPKKLLVVDEIDRRSPSKQKKPSPLKLDKLKIQSPKSSWKSGDIGSPPPRSPTARKEYHFERNEKSSVKIKVCNEKVEC